MTTTQTAAQIAPSISPPISPSIAPLIAPDTAQSPRLRHVHCLDTRGLHRMAYWEWGEPDNPQVLVCVHGLTRQGRDFDTLAQDLCGAYRVICPDIVGRGRSDRLADAAAYGIPTYVADMVTLLARLDVAQVDWVGTSMGGLIGMGVAALAAADGGPGLVRRMVLNDVGPRIEPLAIARIGSYVGLPARWASVDEAADALAAISAGFGPHSREQWLALTRPQLVPAPVQIGQNGQDGQDGRDGQGPGWMSHYDPAIGVPLRAMTPQIAAFGEAALWAAYDRLRCQTLLLRGAESDLLSVETAQAMTERGPRARLHEFAGVGHAPTLVQADQRAVVRDFLLAV